MLSPPQPFSWQIFIIICHDNDCVDDNITSAPFDIQRGHGKFCKNEKPSPTGATKKIIHMMSKKDISPPSTVKNKQTSKQNFTRPQLPSPENQMVLPECMLTCIGSESMSNKYKSVQLQYKMCSHVNLS